ncbi:restriction endonuclease subunit S [Latilactobacillus fragifolii]|uniref:restriction endonuclease subunit S n=1 Tax=Latilactobacillus fragifolii TaxID=2814244 RepID=UPI001F3AE1E9|nr:restriction endonuclease subunit S [Latilactobacillus fragifolii]
MAFPKKINKIEIEKIPFFKTRTEEEIKIGDFFENLNYIVNLQQRRLELLKKLKRGYLQQMFPAKNQYSPRLRFKEFNDDWKQSKLGNQVLFINGRAYKQNELLDFGKYRVLRVGNFNTNDKWYYSNLELEPDKYANKGDLLYIWATDFGPKMWNEEKVIYHYHIWKLNILNKKLNKQYLFIWLQTDKERIKQSTNGTTMLHVTKGNIEQRNFQYPQIHEQQKIGKFFQTLDQFITLQQSKIKQLQQLKQAYLQKLFP